ncbi:MAG: PCRF domain-containing protein, partial [Oscillibacter sp.]|nr:PCRF domain-containing protein [Oscillibacter sp.]
MLEKLKALALRQEDLETQLGEPAVYGDAEKLRAINRELKEIGPVVEAYKAYQKAEQDRAAAEELLRDPDFRELAQEELAHIRVTAEKLRPLFGKTMTAIADGLFDAVSVPERYQLMDRCILRMDEHLDKYADTRIAYPDI